MTLLFVNEFNLNHYYINSFGHSIEIGKCFFSNRILAKKKKIKSLYSRNCHTISYAQMVQRHYTAIHPTQFTTTFLQDYLKKILIMRNARPRTFFDATPKNAHHD